MAITAAQVKELREMTGAGMMDCKKALTATEGDMDKAVEFLREKGLATAQKKASRVAAEGLCKTLVSEDEKKAVVVEVNSETDFVAKNAKFQAYVAQVAAQALTTTATDMDAFMDEKWTADESLTVKEALSSEISIIGENMSIRRFKQVTEENGFVSSYIHARAGASASRRSTARRACRSSSRPATAACPATPDCTASTRPAGFRTRGEYRRHRPAP